MQKKIVAAVCAAMLALAMPAAAIAGDLTVTEATSNTKATFAMGKSETVESGVATTTGALLQGSKWTVTALSGDGNANKYTVSSVTPSTASVANSKQATGIAITNGSSVTEQAGNLAKVKNLALSLVVSSGFADKNAITKITDGKGVATWVWGSTLGGGNLNVATTNTLSFAKGETITIETWIGGDDMEASVVLPNNANGGAAAADDSNKSPKTGE